MKLVWSPEALNDLTEVRSFIAKDNPTAANQVAHCIVQFVANRLSGHPESGRVGRVAGTDRATYALHRSLTSA